MGNWESHEGSYGSLDIKTLKIDQAFFTAYSFLQRNVTIYTLSEDCDKCSPSPLLTLTLDDSGNSTATVDCKYPTDIFVTNGSSDVYHEDNLLCRISETFGEFGVYEMNITNSLESPCVLATRKEPVNAYFPLLPCFLFYILLAVVWILGTFVVRKYRSSKKDNISDESNVDKGIGDTGQTPAPQRQRLKSIDTFRGICIVIMIFVNMGGGSYAFFDHATWNGLHVADLVFPWFLWIMGVCIPISMRSMLKRSTPPSVIFRRILKRSIYLFLIGIILSSGNNLKYLRIFGVLQRFSLTYFVVANLMLVFGRWYIKEIEASKWSWLDDVKKLLPQWFAIIAITAAQVVLTFVLPVPGCPTNVFITFTCNWDHSGQDFMFPTCVTEGYLGPGGRHEHGDYEDCTGGASGYIDRLILTPNHLYQHPTIKEIYDTQLPYDPEGILGTLTSCLQVFIGVQAGSTLLTFADPRPRLIRWVSWGVVTGALGALLCEGSRDDGWIPLNKNLWSLSFVLVTSSFAFFLLAVCYIAIDVKKWWSGAPFYYPGMNSILLYIGHNMTYSMFPFTWIAEDMQTHGMQMAVNLWSTSLWVLVAVWLFHIKFFLAL